MKNLKITVIVFLLFATYFKNYGQCPNNNSLAFGAPNNLTPPSVGTTSTNVQIWAGEYATVNVINGANYTFKTCVGNTNNTALTLYTDIGSVLKGFNDDFCGVQSQITWTSDFTGVLRVLIDDMPGCASGGTNLTLDVTLNSLPCTTPTLNLVGQTNVLCNGGSTGSATMSALGGAPYTYTWFPSGGNAAIASGLSANIYTCITTNSCGLTSSRTVTITQPATALNTSTAVANVLCFGNSTGAATVTASGGTGPYTYFWSSTQTTSVITNLIAASRTYTVTDANGCKSTGVVNVTQPSSALNTATAATNVLCFGNSTGAATVTASGGTSPYTYLWSSAQTTSVISSLNAGVRTVTVTDANGCISTKNVTITQPASALSTATAVTNVLCFGNSTGAATVTASGGTAPYTYFWSSTQTTSVITGLFAGARTYTVTDANGCKSFGSINVTQPTSSVTATQSQTNITCLLPLGTAQVGASGGTPGYTYSWSPSGGISATETALSPGNYTCIIKDANQCSAAKFFTITSNTSAPPVTISSSTNTICSGQSATLTASGASSYTWVTTSNSSSIVVSPTTATSYSVIGLNAVNGCTASFSSLINVNASPTVAINSGSICSGQSFTLSPSGAGPGGSYIIFNTTGTVTSIVSPSITTTYSLIGGSAFGCISTNTAITTLTVFNTPTVTVNSGAICPGGSFTIVPSGANTYTITGGTSIVSPVLSTNYSVTGTSTQGCVSSNTAISSVTVNTTPTVSVNSGAICPGGSFTIVPSGANTYTITGGTSIVSPVLSTNYSVTGTSTQGCVSSNIAISSVTVNTTPTVSVNSGAICPSGSFTIVPSGANTYTITGGTSIVSPVLSTNYSVTGTSAQGCVSSNTAISSVTVNTTPTVSVNSGAICSGDSFTIVPSGANTYTITGGTSIVSPVLSTNYSVTGTSAQGCVSSNTAISSVTVNSLPILTVPSVTICAGSTATLNASGANTYTWNTGSNASSILVAPVTTTTYNLNGTSATGCLSSLLTVTVTVGAVPSIIVNSSTVCAGNSATLNASGVTSYTWNTGANSASIVVTPTVNTTYTVSGNLTGCSVGANNTTTVTVNALPIVSAISNSSLLCVGQMATLTASGANTYIWNTTGTSSIEVISPTVTTTYTVNGTDANGCSNFATITQSVAICTGLVNDIDGSNKILFYPNPTSNKLIVRYESIPERVEVFNAIGQKLEVSILKKDQEIEIDLSNEASGIYILELRDGINLHRLKVLKQD
ncbi:MAG: T9SS type A sorting domain-containing protein [Bacteroidota bacterium]|nr:T9SS type A sorting domain-containing protein [Bacteroidota bacterium]